MFLGGSRLVQQKLGDLKGYKTRKEKAEKEAETTVKADVDAAVPPDTAPKKAIGDANFVGNGWGVVGSIHTRYLEQFTISEYVKKIWWIGRISLNLVIFMFCVCGRIRYPMFSTVFLQSHAESFLQEMELGEPARRFACVLKDVPYLPMLSINKQ